MGKHEEHFKNIKHIIFDLDGTLINTARLTVPACRHAAEMFGLPEKSARRMVSLIGWPSMDYYYMLYPEIQDKCLLMEYALQVEKFERANMMELGRSLLYKGVWPMLHRLKKEGFSLHIASLAPQDHTDTALDNTGIRFLFDSVKCNGYDKTAMIKEIMYGSTPDQWLILGDKHFDAQAGKNNGILTVAARYGFGDREEYMGFDLYINKPIHLLDILSIENK